MRKVFPDARTAMAGLVKDGMTLMSGGFGLCGIPEALIEAVKESGAKGLTFIVSGAATAHGACSGYRRNWQRFESVVRSR